MHQLTLAEDTSKVAVLNQLSKQYRYSDSKKTMQYAQQAYELAKALNFKQGSALAFNNMGIAYYLQNKYPEAIKYFEQTVQMNKEIGNLKGEGDATNNIGLIHWKTGDYPKAIACFLQGLKIDEQRHDDLGVAQALNNIGNIYAEQQDYEPALRYYFKALTLKKKFPAESGNMAITYDNIGSTYFDQQKYPEALKYFFESMKNWPEQNKEGRAVNLSNIGLVYTKLQAYPQALSYFAQALPMQQALDDQDNMVSTLEGLASVYEQTGDLAKSQAYAQQCLNIAQKIGDRQKASSAYQLLAELANQQNQSAKAYQYHVLYTQIKDSILNESNTRKVAVLQANYETQKKKAEIQLLQEEKSREVLIRNLLGIGFLASFVIGGLVFSRQRLKIRGEKELSDKNQQIFLAQQALSEAEITNSQIQEKQLKEQLEFRNRELTTQTLNIIQKNALMEEVRELINEILQANAGPDRTSSVKYSRLIKLIDYSFSLDKDWDEFKLYFEQVHQDFFVRLKAKYPDLTSGELRLSALVKLNLNLKETATILGISPESVKTSRYRLRKKLNLPEEQNLTDYLITA